MSAQDDVELVRKGFEAFIAGDMVWLNEHFHENIVWHIPGRSSFAGTYQGREEVIAMLLRTVSIALPAWDFHDFLGSQDHVVALANVTWRRRDNDETFDDHAVTIFHIAEEQAVEVWSLQENQYGMDEFIDRKG